MRESRLNRFFYKTAEEKAPVFWTFVIVFYLLLCDKGIDIWFLGKTPYEWDSTFQQLTLALLCILMMREIYDGHFHFGFRTDHFWKGILLCTPALFFGVMDIINYFSYSSINVEGFYMILANSFAVALFEQCVVGGALLGHMMHHWKGKPGGIMKSAVLSSLIFGFMHVGRVFEINTVGTVDLLLKFSYGLGIGMLFAAAYLRTGNLWPVILFHTILDFFSMLSRIYMQPVADVDAYYAKYPSPAFSSNIITMEKMSGVISVLLIVLAVFELRKKEHGAINAVWDGMCEPAAEKPLSAAGSGAAK